MAAFDLLPFGVTEADFAFGSAGASGYSAGAVLTNTQYGGVAALFTLADAGGGLGDFIGDVIVQTAASDAGAGATEWTDTDSRINNINALGTYRINVASPILQKVRLRIARTDGTQDLTWTVRWLADKSLSLN